jgi:hypothetical protein
MKILQTAYQDTYIGPIDRNSKLGMIAHHQQVPLENKNLMKYMMEPVQGSNNNFSTKIIIHANHELKDYLVTPQFRSYLRDEQITISHNELDTVVPMNVGFLKQATQSRETLILHKARLQQYLPKNAPDFQVNLYKAFNSSRKSTFMVMVQTDKNNVTNLTNMMKTASRQYNLGFFPFQTYLGLNSECKKQCINNLKKWNSTFKSICVEGFNNNNDNVPMKVRDNEEMSTVEDDELYTTSVSNYLRNLINPTTGNKFFDYVFPTILNTREFVISTDNCGDTESFLEVIKGEMARDMNRLSMKLEFKNPAAVLHDSEMVKWESFDVASEIVNKTKDQSSFNKRSRVYEENDHYNNTPQPIEYKPATVLVKNTTKMTYSEATDNNLNILSPMTSVSTYVKPIEDKVNEKVNSILQQKLRNKT